MTPAQFDYIYKGVKKHAKVLGLPMLGKQEFKAYLEYMGITHKTDVDAAQMTSNLKVKLTSAILNLSDDIEATE